MKINLLLIAVLIVFGVLINRGYKKGFLKIIVSFLGMILILSAVRRVSPYVSDFLIENTGTYEKLQMSITERFAEANSVYDNTIPQNQTLTIKSYDLPELIKGLLIENNTEEMYQNLIVELFDEYVSAYLARTAIKALSFVVLFVVFIILFKLILVMVDIISKIPLLGGLNRLAGAALGFIEALLIVWIFFFVTVLLVGQQSGAWMFEMIGQSKILTALYNSNILISLIV